MDAIVPRSSKGLEKLIQNRTRTSAVPPVGELWPWLLADLAGIRPSRIRRVAEAWLALYLYSSALDETVDAPRESPPLDPIASSLLLQLGFSDLMTLTAGTRWSRLIVTSASRAMKYQAIDVQLRHTRGKLKAKREAAAGKNSGYAAIAAAIGLEGNVDPAPLVRFARGVQLALQHLDDVGDFEEDYRSGNFTPLLSSWAATARTPHIDALSRADLLEELIRSGALESVLLESLELISRGRRNVMRSYTRDPSQPRELRFISQIEVGLQAAVGETLRTRILLLKTGTHMEERRSAVKTVERQLVIVAQQS